MKGVLIILLILLCFPNSLYATELYMGRAKRRDYLLSIVIFLGSWGTIHRLQELYGLNHYFLMVFLSLNTLLLCSLKDVKSKEIPLEILFITSLLGIVLLFINPNVTYIESLLGIGIGGTMLLLSYITRQGIGQGDGLVIGVIGLLLGWQMTLAILMYGLILSGLYGGYLLIIMRKSRKTKIAFVPFLYIATLIIYLV